MERIRRQAEELEDGEEEAPLRRRVRLKIRPLGRKISPEEPEMRTEISVQESSDDIATVPPTPKRKQIKKKYKKIIKNGEVIRVYVGPVDVAENSTKASENPVTEAVSAVTISTEISSTETVSNEGPSSEEPKAAASEKPVEISSQEPSTTTEAVTEKPTRKLFAPRRTTAPPAAAIIDNDRPNNFRARLPAISGRRRLIGSRTTTPVPKADEPDPENEEIANEVQEVSSQAPQTSRKTTVSQTPEDRASSLRKRFQGRTSTQAPKASEPEPENEEIANEIQEVSSQAPVQFSRRPTVSENTQDRASSLRRRFQGRTSTQAPKADEPEPENEEIVNEIQEVSSRAPVQFSRRPTVSENTDDRGSSLRRRFQGRRRLIGPSSTTTEAPEEIEEENEVQEAPVQITTRRKYAGISRKLPTESTSTTTTEAAIIERASITEEAEIETISASEPTISEEASSTDAPEISSSSELPSTTASTTSTTESTTRASRSETPSTLFPARRRGPGRYVGENALPLTRVLESRRIIPESRIPSEIQNEIDPSVPRTVSEARRLPAGARGRPIGG